MKSRFFRLETVNGQGIYRALFTDEIYGNIFGATAYEEIHPPPSRDKILTYYWADSRRIDSLVFPLGQDRYNYIFGFCSLAQLRAWFPPILIKNIMAARVKIILSVYQSDDIIKGDRQSIMRKSSGELVMRLNLKHLLK